MYEIIKEGDKMGLDSVTIPDPTAAAQIMVVSITLVVIFVALFLIDS